MSDTDKQLENLRQFILDHIETLWFDGSSGSSPKLAQFELYAEDYLGFADRELSEFRDSSHTHDRTQHLINCVSNLKRAVDCQLDSFLYALNLYDIFMKRGLKFEKKLEFLQSAGVFSSRSLTRLNSTRNKVEHQFQIPQIDDLEVYYDLVTAFVVVLQRTTLFLLNAESDYVVDEGDEESASYFLRSEYLVAVPEIRFLWGDNSTKNELKCDMTDYHTFATLLKFLLMLDLKDTTVSSHYVKLQLNT